MSDAALPQATRIALKEWAVACEALGRGDQVLLLRKGGISEEHREFRVEHAEFFLFPTFEHQRLELVKPASQADLQKTLADRGAPDRVELRFWAQVAATFAITTAEQLQALDNLHLWSADYAHERLRWKPRKPLQALALRVYRLAEPIRLPLRPEYGGCKSWLTFQEPFGLEGAQPVLKGRAFEAQLARIQQALAAAPAEVEAR